MRDHDSFEFDATSRGSSQFPAVLMALVAIAAILIVNLTALVPSASASVPSPTSRSAGYRPMAPVFQDAKRLFTSDTAPGCTTTRARTADTLRM